MSKIGRAIGFVLVALLCISLILGGLGQLFGPPLSPGDIKVTTLTGTLATNPEIEDYRKDRSVRLLLNEYPSRSFNIVDDAFTATKSGIINDNVSSGDTVFLEVAAEDYESNIATAGTPERMLPVTVYGFRSKTQVFLSIADYCKSANSNGWVGIVCLVFGITLSLATYFGLRKERQLRKQSSTNKQQA